MNVLDLGRATPRHITVPVAAAAGMALGFYPRPCSASGVLLAAFGLAGIGFALRGLDAARGAVRRPRAGLRVWAALFVAFAIGLVSGFAAARDDEARGSLGASPLLSSRGPARLALSSIEGRLAADSSPAKGGFRSYRVMVSRIALTGRALSGNLEFPDGPPGAIRALVRGGPLLDAGARIEVACSPGQDGSALFGRPGGVSVRDAGGRIAIARGAIRSTLRVALARVGRRSSGLLEALLLGARDNLDAEVADAFKAAGCSHVLALSGQHLSVLAVLVVAALKPLCGPFRARAGAAAAAAAFMWIAGPGPSLIRAVLMTWIGVVALVLDRPQEWLGLLALSFLIALPIDPAAARSLAFLLSYLAVWGLAILAPRFQFLLDPALPPILSAAAAASLGAQAATGPIMAFAFGSLQGMGILASMVSAPLVTALMWWGIGAAALCALLPCAAGPAAFVSDFLYDLLVAVMRVAASVPPLALPGIFARVAASVAIVLVAGLVYAYPWMAYRRHRRH